MRMEKEVPIGDKRGMHLRVIQTFVMKAQEFSSQIRVQSPTAKADGKSPIEMMLLKGSPGTKLKLIAEGEDAREALEALAGFISNPEPQAAPGEGNTMP